jgi:hypothetical protein
MWLWRAHTPSPNNLGCVSFLELQIVVLTWCESARDVGMVKRILTQVCSANEAQKGGTVVVLAQVGQRQCSNNVDERCGWVGGWGGGGGGRM